MLHSGNITFPLNDNTPKQSEIECTEIECANTIWIRMAELLNSYFVFLFAIVAVFIWINSSSPKSFKKIVNLVSEKCHCNVNSKQKIIWKSAQRKQIQSCGTNKKKIEREKIHSECESRCSWCNKKICFAALEN